MSEDLLKQLLDFLSHRTFIVGDEATIRDMLSRYKHPPLTLHSRVVMQMSIPDYQAFAALIEKVAALYTEETAQ